MTTQNCSTCRNNKKGKCSIKKAIACWWTQEYKYYEPKEPKEIFLTESDMQL